MFDSSEHNQKFKHSTKGSKKGKINKNMQLNGGTQKDSTNTRTLH